ncbi:hypothetical protein GCM10023331_30950 [Algivirga pacifica]|uniref:Uncharacterized protein n=2 Tax=Algivirga pacifica TaxID=1162670 RepID=A0ABP9DFC8_9BACT
MVSCQGNDDLTPVQKENISNMRVAVADFKEGDDQNLIYFLNNETLFEELKGEVEKVVDMDVEFDEDGVRIDYKALMKSGEEVTMQKVWTMEEFKTLAATDFTASSEEAPHHMIWVSNSDSTDGVHTHEETIEIKLDETEQQHNKIIIIKENVDGDAQHIEVMKGIPGAPEAPEEEGVILQKIKEKYGEDFKEISDLSIMIKDQKMEVNAKVLLQDGSVKEETFSMDKPHQEQKKKFRIIKKYD